MAQVVLNPPLSSGSLTARLLAAARWSLVIVLAWSAGGKLFWPAAFEGLMRASGMIEPGLARLAALAVPAVEFVAALLLAVHAWRPIGAALSLFLSLTFSGFHSYLLWAGEVVPCGCAGVAITFNAWITHVAMLGLSLWMVAASTWVLAHWASMRPEPPPMEPATAG